MIKVMLVIWWVLFLSSIGGTVWTVWKVWEDGDASIDSSAGNEFAGSMVVLAVLVCLDVLFGATVCALQLAG